MGCSFLGNNTLRTVVDINKRIFVFIITCLLQSVPALAGKSSDIETILLKILTPQMQEAVSEYYSPYLTHPPTVAYYEARICEVKNNKVCVELLPYVGAHNPVGRDRITFDIAGSGAVTVNEYLHLESYTLPPHQQSLKPLP
jgi:hypothetical protein